MSFVILMRNPNGKALTCVTDNDGEDMAEFNSEDEAEQCAEEQMLCKAWGYQVVEVEV